MQILTTVWGRKHVDLFKKTTLESLSWSDNKQALTENRAVWNICTDLEFTDELRADASELLPGVEVKFKSTEDLRNYTDTNQSAVIGQIEECLKLNEKLLVAPPDNIFANGSIKGLLLAGREPGTVVIAPHVRVLPEFVSTYTSPQPEDMVRDSFKHLHQSWSDAEIGHVRQNSFVGGVKWQRLSESLIQVWHYLPSPFLMQFTSEDLQYFKTQISFGSFDHVWPNDILIPRGRMRYVTSSDQVFIAEVTDKDKNVPPIWDGNVDDFWRKNQQYHFNKQIVSTFRMVP